MIENQTIDLSDIVYSVPQGWYDGWYKDKRECCKAARSFSMVHSEKPDECWLIIHGYRGYPGEFVRPAVDLYSLGFDVFVPRLPGHGTSWKDFERSGAKDWVGVASQALSDLKIKYNKVNIVAHSMGTAIAVKIAWNDPAVGKIVMVSPSFINLQMSLWARIVLRLAGLFTPRLNCHWHQSSKFHLHYENAPADEMFLGQEYWTWFFTHRLFDYWHLSRNAPKVIAASFRKALAEKAEKAPKAGKAENTENAGNAGNSQKVIEVRSHLILCPLLDKLISVPSTDIFTSIVGTENANVVRISDGTHFLFYDKSVQAEQLAVNSICQYALQSGSGDRYLTHPKQLTEMGQVPVP